MSDMPLSRFCVSSRPNAPHAPYNVEPAYSDRYKGRACNPARERFYGMITNIDENFGALTQKLDELGIADNTIVIFMTDNGSGGGVAGDADHFVVSGYNDGLRGAKGSPYDGGHRGAVLYTLGQWQSG